MRRRPPILSKALVFQCDQESFGLEWHGCMQLKGASVFDRCRRNSRGVMGGEWFHGFMDMERMKIIDLYLGQRQNGIIHTSSQGQERCAPRNVWQTPHLRSHAAKMHCLRAVIACVVFASVMSDSVSAQEEHESVEQIFQELFLGESVYPQEARELQFTTGFLFAHERQHDSRIPVLIEYGLTDRLQIGIEVPIDFLGADDGVGNIELEGYWNLLNDRRSGWAAGIGLGLGLPTATPEVGEEELIYEPFFIVYRELDSLAINFSAGLEIEDSSEITGELAVALIKRWKPFVLILETGLEIEPDETSLRLAPAIYWQPPCANWELGVSVPVGLNADTPDIGVFVLFTIEFGGTDDDELAADDED